MLKSIFICISLSLAVPAYSQQSNQNVSLPFLLFTPDAASAGMGDVTATSFSDLYSLHNNAAKYSFSRERAGFGMTFMPWKQTLADDMNLVYLVGYYKLDSLQTIAAGFRYFTEGTNTFTNELGNELYSYKPSDLAFDIAYIRKLSERISLSTTLRYIRSNATATDMLDGVQTTANAISSDVGLVYRLPISAQTTTNYLKAAVALANLGPKIRYQSNKYNLPTTGLLEIAYTSKMSEKVETTVAASLRKLLVGNFVDSNKFSGGLEVNFANTWCIRTGYLISKSLPENGNYATFGTGIRRSGFIFDISYWHATSNSGPVNNALRYSLGYSFK